MVGVVQSSRWVRRRHLRQLQRITCSFPEGGRRHLGCRLRLAQLRLQPCQDKCQDFAAAGATITAFTTITTSLSSVAEPNAAVALAAPTAAVAAIAAATAAGDGLAHAVGQWQLL